MSTLEARLRELAGATAAECKRLGNTKANLSGADFSGNISAPLIKTSPNGGYVQFEGGGNDRTGYISFYNKQGGRHGYIGYADANVINLAAELGHFNFSGSTPTIDNNVIWNAGNFNPDTKADKYASNVFTARNNFNDLLSPNIGLETAHVLALNNDGSINKRIHSGFWQFSNCNKSLGYPEDSNTWFNVISATHNNEDNYYALQIASNFFQNSDFYIRCTSNNGNAGWNKLWHNNNFNPDTYLAKSGGEISGIVSFNAQPSINHAANNPIASGPGNLGAIQIKSLDSGGAAFMQFHRPGSYASYFGLDTDNQWKVGGWSAGAVAYRLWHEGNLNPRTPSVDRINFTDQAWLEAVYDPNSQQARIEFKRNNEHPSMYADMMFNKDIRNITATGQGFGGVSAQLVTNNLVGSADVSQWNLLSTLKIYGQGAGQHCASYFQTFRYSNNAAFVSCMEGRDFVANPTVGMAAFELDMFGKGPCNGGQRVALDIVYGGAVIYDAGDQMISEAISISPVHGQSKWVPGQTNGYETSSNTGQSILLTGLRIKGQTVNSIDLTGIDANFIYQGTKARGVYHSNGLLDVWVQGGEFGFLNEALVINMPPNGLKPGGSYPTTADAFLLVNAGGLGLRKVALLPV